MKKTVAQSKSTKIKVGKSVKNKTNKSSAIEVSDKKKLGRPKGVKNYQKDEAPVNPTPEQKPEENKSILIDLLAASEGVYHRSFYEERKELFKRQLRHDIATFRLGLGVKNNPIAMTVKEFLAHPELEAKDLCENLLQAGKDRKDMAIAYMNLMEIYGFLFGEPYVYSPEDVQATIFEPQSQVKQEANQDEKGKRMHNSMELLQKLLLSLNNIEKQLDGIED